MTTIANTARPSFFARIGAALTARHKQARAYSTTRRELSALNDRELADLGINRAMIEEISTQAARRV